MYFFNSLFPERLRDMDTDQSLIICTDYLPFYLRSYYQLPVPGKGSWLQKYFTDISINYIFHDNNNDNNNNIYRCL